MNLKPPIRQNELRWLPFFLSVGPDLDPGARNEEAADLRPILRFVEVPQGPDPAASPKLGGTVSRSEPIP